MKKLFVVLGLLIIITSLTISQNLIPKQYESGKWGYIDANNKWVVEPKFDKVAPFNNGFAGVRYAGKCGYINEQGKLVIAARWDDCFFFYKEGFAMVVNDRGKAGIINKHDHLVIPCIYDNLYDFDGYSWKGELDGEVVDVKLPIKEIIERNI